MSVVADERLARSHRAQEVSLRARTLRDAVRVWPLFDPQRMEETFPAWLSVHAALIRRDHRLSSALAGNYLRAARLSSGVTGAPVVRLVDSLPMDQVTASMSTTARAGFYKALRSGRTVEQARQVALVRTLGSTGRLVLQGGRDTVRGSLRADRRGRGWQRVTGAKACSFCTMLAGRGAVYSAETADFSTHDHCACTVAAVYSEDPIPVRDYEPSSQGRWSARATDADRSRMREALDGIGA